MDECCCQPTGPATLSLARAVSVLTVNVFHTFSKPGGPFFCGRQFFRQCDVVATDNGRCGFAVSDAIATATIPIFGQVFTGTSDPCNSTEQLSWGPKTNALGQVLPIIYTDSTMSELRFNQCWDGTITLSVPTTINDLLAACLANLSLIDINAVPFGIQRRVINDPFTGAPVFSQTGIASAPLPDTCANPVGTTLASSLTVFYGFSGSSFFCTTDKLRRIEMPTYTLRVSASRTRFDATGTWCKRTRTPVLLDPDFDTFCDSRAGTCADTACAHHNAAAGMIDVPALNTSVHIGLCTSPAAPCNPTPIPFP